jgi:hypothetical protein
MHASRKVKCNTPDKDLVPLPSSMYESDSALVPQNAPYSLMQVPTPVTAVAPSPSRKGIRKLQPPCPQSLFGIQVEDKRH